MIRANHFFLFLTAFVFLACAEGNSRQVSTPVPTAEELQADGLEVATFAGGCFWCTEAVFERVKGVSRVVSGYTGGPEKNPTYQQVSYGRTGQWPTPKLLPGMRFAPTDNQKNDPYRVKGG